MLKINSDKVHAKVNLKKVHEFLDDLNNYKYLFPKNKISNWDSTTSSCSLKIQQLYTIDLIKISSTPNSIILKSGDKTSFKFDMQIDLEHTDTDLTTAQISCQVDLNPALKMMVSKPLNELFNYMANRIEKAILTDELD